MNQSLKDKWSQIWFFSILAGCLFLMLTTFFNDQINARSIYFVKQQFNLAVENNFASWWSGTLLLLIALHAFDGYFLKITTVPLEARGWGAMALIFAILSMDEIGSIHERASQLVHLGGVWWSLLPFAIVVLCLLFYGFYALYKAKVSYYRLLLIVCGFGLFGSVVLQEFIEHRIVWEPWMKPIRSTIEEGSELMAMLLLLKACMPNTRGIFSGSPGTGPVFEIASSLRKYLFALSIIALPVYVYVSVLWSDSQRIHYQGHPADWLAAGLFFLAALSASRHFLKEGESFSGCYLALAAVCIFSSCITVAFPPEYKVFLPTTAVSLRMLAMFFAVVVICLLWTLGRCYGKISNRISALIILAVAIASLFTLSGFILYGTPIFIGALVYRINAEGK